jgi:GT2 family glycosyltransferase
VKPLIIITVYNRKEETLATLEALKETTDFEKDVDLVIVDNCSAEDTRLALARWQSENPVNDFHHVLYLRENIGCPRALNRAMKDYRQPGQAVIKLDNDVEILTMGWLEHFERFLEAMPQVAMVGPWYDELADEKRLKEKRRVNSFYYYPVFPLIGHMAWHAGWFLDRVGYFDVLADNHLYGFEDLLMCQKAAILGYEMAVLPAVKVKMLQRKNALDVAGLESRDAHVARLRPEYERRVMMVWQGEHIFTDENGQPKIEGE